MKGNVTADVVVLLKNIITPDQIDIILVDMVIPSLKA